MGDNALRSFPAVTNGCLYLSFMLRYQNPGHKSGLVLTDAGVSREYFGYHTSVNGLYMFEYPSAYQGLQDSMTAGVPYTVVARVDLDARTMACMMITNQTGSMPWSEPSTWQLTKTNLQWASHFDGILLFGFTDSIHSDAIYDEIRIARSWSDLVSQGDVRDSDGDGLEDSWELRWFSSLTDADATSDWDDDHFYDWQEAAAGTNPTNNQSFLGMQMPPTSAVQGGIVVRWQSVTGKLYTVERTTNLTLTGGGFLALRQHIQGMPSTTAITDTTASASAMNIYRVMAETNTDVDVDGIIDAWEVLWFSSLTGADGSSDWDHDGFLDWQESRAGTNPTNSLSLLELQLPMTALGTNGIVVRWQSVTGKFYAVWRTTNLIQVGGGFLPTHQHVPGLPSSTAVTDTTASASSPNIYRVGVE
jgi:hypothetical protein